MSHKTKIVFDHIAIIFNPISTGNAPAMANSLSKKILASPNISIKPTLTPTKYAGHAIELAEHISLNYKHPLIISVSGDGGYNEVVNGAMKAKVASKTAAPVITIVGAGNANDHQRVMRDDDTSLLSLIQKAHVKSLDLLRITVKGKEFDLDRYAHSYIGFGITPQVAVELNKHQLNTFQEIRIVIRAFLRYKSFLVEYKGQKRRVDSLIFANINEMAKILKLNQERNTTDSLFEVIEFPHRNKAYLLYMMLLAAARGLRDQPQHKEYTFKTTSSRTVQLDGEVEKMPHQADVTIVCVPAGIDSLY